MNKEQKTITNMAIQTIIYTGESKWGRPTYIKLVDNKVIYDDSDDEYGPIEFDIKLLIEALNKHINQMKTMGDTITRQVT